MVLWMTEEELDISKETIRKFLVEDFGKQDICVRFVPHSFADFTDCQLIRSSFILWKYRLLLDTLVTGDETWCFQYVSSSSPLYSL
jgi:hypothetical protein